ncbi:putative benzoate 4-monooxygenase cytochrome P450 [Lophiostoma macrostomum CBS 122681]|uniref:Putative benzoate 4-monooxygenase cytochrome P450 n=1 Tax=Lophiostoma macrostomum CBS 122681 TaxID=1314788 RepID=A0A6A6SR38_9PLEO|nr:putative benzoate 4-monooxygenase cytochrome P450 [Lophiostoma macrostomum CBS 122681]
MEFSLWLKDEHIFAAVVGVASHLCFYKHGEHHMEAPILLWLHLAAFVGLFYCKVLYSDAPRGATDTVSIFSSYLFALFMSIAIYRRYFHRLRNFPGPAMASVSKLWHTAQCYNGQNHLLLDNLHKQYGDFVRTGPTEITVFTPEVKWAVDGPLNKCTKAVWYDILLPLTALNTNRSKAEHDQRRRVWDQAITVKKLVEYECRIRDHALLLEKHIASTAGQPINITEWFYFLAFDVMGDFAFSKSFDMLENKQWHYAVVLLRRALGLLGPFSSVPWLAQVAFSLPVIPIIRDWNRMLSWCADRMAEQIQAIVRCELKNENISSWLLRHSFKKNSMANDKLMLKGDSVALIVAGSDTVASTMINLFYRLALHPEHAVRIREELDSIPSIQDSQTLKSLSHLNGAINEVLRLHPSVPTGGYRESPPEGVEVAGTWIPGNTTIVAPRYTLGRLEKIYERPEEFVPERWYSRPQMVKDRSAFNPFSMGRYACVGKNLALAEIRFVTALLVTRYEIAFAPGEDGTRVWKEMKDQFTAVPGKLDLVFSPIVS